MSEPRDFIIAWLDDEEANIDAIRADVEAHIRWMGWNPVIKEFRTDSLEFQTYVEDPRTCLIITDLHLLHGQHGSMVIERLRTNGLWHEILLYSADANALFQAIHGIDGIFWHAFSTDGLTGLKNKIEAVIEAVHTKDQYVQIRMDVK